MIIDIYVRDKCKNVRRKVLWLYNELNCAGIASYARN